MKRGNGSRARAVNGAVKCAALLVIAGCTASATAVEPPADALFYPTGVAVSPDDAVLFVANGNSELRYSSGTLSVFDLAKVDQTVAAWTGARTIPSGCAPDTDFSETLVCTGTAPRCRVPQASSRCATTRIA